MDQIQLLLQSTGLSPDELIKRLAQYKAAEKGPVIKTENTSGVHVKDEDCEEIIDSPEIICIDDDDCDTDSANITSTDKSDIVSQTPNIKNEIIDLSDDDDDVPLACINGDKAAQAPAIISNNSDNADVKPSILISDDSQNDSKEETRLKITALLAKRLTEKSDDNLQEKSSRNEETCNEKLEEEGQNQATNDNISRKPLFGSIRKTEGTGRKTVRATKPPWMDKEVKIEKSVDERPKEKCTEERAEENIEESPPTSAKVDSAVMREQIFNQLQMLRGKKGTEEPLVENINSLIDTNPVKLTKRREKNEDKENNLGIKIVEVRGGINEIAGSSKDCNTTKEVKDTEETIDISQKSSETSDKENKNDYQIINEHLDSDVIQVTKTNSFKKIKGWKSKKLKIQNETKDKVEVENPCTKQHQKLVINIPLNANEAVPSCSYAPSPVTSNISKLPIDIEIATTTTTTVDNNIIADIKTEVVEEGVTEGNIFASNNLDGFLDAQRNLNISYDVPNLQSSDKNVVDYLDDRILINQIPLSEPRTETKRLFTMAENENSDCINQNAKSNPYKPRTLAEKRKMLESENESLSPAPAKILKEEDGLIKRLRAALPSNVVFSTISFKGKQLTIPSLERKVTKLGRRMKKHKNIQEFKIERDVKPSIYNIKQETVKYKPGPLSKKSNLQTTGSNWETVIKDLPKVYLDVKPEPGKRFHPNIAQYLNFNTYEISKERAEFASNAVIDENSKAEKCRFNIPYEYKQEKIKLLRSAIKAIPTPELILDVKKEETEEEVNAVIDKVVDDILTYVETKDVEKEEIPYDDCRSDSDEELLIVKEREKKRSKKAEIIKGKTKRTNLELKRLNVKVIEVNIEEDNQDSVVCTKTSCKMGCVCKSLKNTPLPNDHCRKFDCQLQCTCSYDKTKRDTLKFLLPAGTDLLSDRTVSRLQDEAKKDLARVEAQFTQTVIHANNQTIVVGENTDRKRRPLKLPNKYKDYIESNIYSDGDKSNESDDELIIKTITLDRDSPRKSCTVGRPKEKMCRVLLKRLDLSHVIPLCMTHCQYNCPCNYQDLCGGISRLSKIQLKPISQLSAIREEPTPALKRKYYYTKKKFLGEPKKSVREIKKPVRFVDEQCARTQGLSQEYYLHIYHRNKSKGFKRKLARKYRFDDLHDSALERWLTIGTGPDPKVDTTLSGLDSVDIDPFLIPMSVGPVDDSKPSRRKQLLMNRSETSIPIVSVAGQQAELAMQRKKKATAKLIKKATPPGKISVATIQNNLKLNSETILPAAIENQHFAKLMGQTNNKDIQFRLLPWATLISKYEEKIVYIWVHQDKTKFKYILTNSDDIPAPGYENINKFETVSLFNIQPDFVRWVMQRQVPDNRKEGGRVFVILKITKNSWEICGICSRNGKNAEAGDIPGTTINMNKPENGVSITNSTSNNQENVSAEKKKKYEVSFTNTTYSLKNFAPYSDIFKKNVVSDNLLIKACLPDTHDDHAKWRFIKLSSEFSVLSLTRNDFKIKCSDILSVLKVAARYQKTIIINNEQVSRNYSHKLFGLYMSPNYVDHIFVGPYFHYEKHDVETLQYVNNVLVNSDLFMKEYESQNTSSGQWYYQISPDKAGEIEKTPTVIDLTGMDDSIESTSNTPKASPKSVLKNSVLNGEKESGVSLDAIKKDNSAVVILEQKECHPMERVFASRLRILIRNHHLPLPLQCVPICFKVNFDKGLIYGYQHEAKNQVGIFWPGDQGAPGRLFENCDTAINWLQMELNTFFVLVPSNFKITVAQITPAEYRTALSRPTISTNYFKEVYVVGKFGALSLQDLAKDLTKFHEGTEAYDPSKLSSWNTNLKEFYEGGDQEFVDFIVKIKAHINMEEMKATKLIFKKNALEAKKYSLLTRHSSLIKQVAPATKEQITKEFMQKWTTTNPSRSPPKLSPILPLAPIKESEGNEVICLDSDDEDTTKRKQTNPEKNINDRVMHPPNNAKTTLTNKTLQSMLEEPLPPILYPQIELDKQKMSPPKLAQKRRSSTEIILVSNKVKPEELIIPLTNAEIIPIPVIYATPGQSVLKKTVIKSVTPVPAKKMKTLKFSKMTRLKPMSNPISKSISILQARRLPKLLPATSTNFVKPKKKPVEQIDISHISAEKLSAVLGTSIKNIVSLSEDQLNKLKALSETKP